MRVMMPTVAFAVMTALAGCAAAMPGYVPDKSRLKLATDKSAAKAAAKADPAPATPVANGGTYTLSASERGLNCKRLTGVVQVKIMQYRADAARAPASTVKAAVETALAKPMAGAPPSDAGELARDRARLVAFNEQMIEKKCGHFDLAAALDPANTANPELIKPEGKKPKKAR